MITTGYSKPYVATYAASGTTVTYTGVTALGRGVDNQLSINTVDGNDFFADNALAESIKGKFASGDLVVTIDGLEDTVAAKIYGLPTATSVTVGTESYDIRHYGDGMQPPFLGYGFVRKGMKNGVTKYQPIVLTKIKFAEPEDSMHTEEESVDWQTQALNATVFRDDTANHDWKLVGPEVDTEAIAESIVKKLLGATA